MQIKLEQDTDGKLYLTIGDTPKFELSPDETIRNSVKRQIESWDREANIPRRGDDPWAEGYARKLDDFLRSLVS